MRASELIQILQRLKNEHGDLEIIHEDNGCNLYLITGAVYDEREEGIRLT